MITDIIDAFKQVRPADKTAKTEMLNYKDILKKIKPPKKKPRVWLLEKEKIGYIRLRKVASSSINRCLTQHIVNSTDQQDVVIDWALVKATEERYSSHIEHSVIRRDLKGKYFLFAFVRNPLGRVWSCYKNKIINIHPSLLPSFPGAQAYRQAYEHGVKIAGVTAHFVSMHLDEGPIIAQDGFVVRPSMSIKDIVKRGQKLESRVLLKAVKLYLSKRLDVYWGVVKEV